MAHILAEMAECAAQNTVLMNSGSNDKMGTESLCAVAGHVGYILYYIFHFLTNHTKLSMTRLIYQFSCGENDSYPSLGLCVIFVFPHDNSLQFMNW
jgi:hypothetical protein